MPDPQSPPADAPVLVVEGRVATLGLLAALLIAEGFSVIAASPATALEAVRRWAPTLVAVDGALTGTEHQAALAALRGAVGPNVPVLVIADSDVLEADALVHRVRAALASAAGLSPVERRVL